MRPLLPVLVLLLASCAEIPRLPGVPEPGAEGLPRTGLVPLGPILAAAGPVPPAETAAAPVAARAAALRARAAALRGPVVDRTVRTRMEAGVAVPARLR